MNSVKHMYSDRGADRIRQVKMIMCTHDALRYYGLLLLNKKIHISTMLPEGITACVSVERDCPVITISRKFLENPETTHKQIIRNIIHEQLHLLHAHGPRLMNRILPLWNFAADHVVECTIKHENYANIATDIKSWCIIPELENSSMTTEEVYDWIITNKIRFVYDGNCIKDLKTGNTWLLGELPFLNEKDTEIINKMVANTTAVCDFPKQKGNHSGELATFLNKLTSVRFDPFRILENAIKRAVSIISPRRSWSMPNIHYIAYNMYLPGIINKPTETDAIGRLIVIQDSSYSISDKNLEHAGYIITKLMHNFKALTLFVHDVEVHQVVEFDPSNIDGFISYLKDTGIKGRGGTSHKYVFDEIESKYQEDEFADEHSITICFTDGESDIDQIYSNYKWIRNPIPLIFIVEDSGWRLEDRSRNISTITL